MADESVFDNSDCDLPPVTPVPTEHMLVNPLVPEPPADIPDCDDTPLDPLDEDPPCPPLTISTPTITIVPELEHPPTISFTLTRGPNCDYDFDLDIELGCPTGMTPNDGSPATKSISFGTNGLSFAFTKTADNCDFDLDIDIDVPCPPLAPFFVSNTPTPILFSDTPTIQFGFAVGTACDYTLDIEMTAPCPPITPTTPTEVPVVYAEALVIPAMVYQFAKGPSCDYELQIEEITIPCPSVTPPAPGVQATTVSYAASDEALGYVKYGFTPKPDCEHELDIEIELPCPKMTPFYDTIAEDPIRVDLDPDDTPYGELKYGFVYNSNCQWELRMELKTGCMPVLPLVETPFSDITYAQESYALKYHFEASETECKKTFSVTDLVLPCPPDPQIDSDITMGAMGSDPEFIATVETTSDCTQSWVLHIKVPAGGPQGYQGYQGFQGEFGQQGYQGFQGWQGWQGADSTVAGPQGFQGNDGQQGWQGWQGNPGNDSTMPGPQGWQGFQGDIGQQGAMGFQGAPGDKLAIVPYGDRFIGLACVEAGEPRFEEIITVKLVRDQFRKILPIDDRYVQACEPLSIKAVSAVADWLVRVAVRVVNGHMLCVMIDPHEEDDVEVTVKLSGLRKGHVWRFREFNRDQYESNLRFWDGWQRQGAIDFSPN